MNISFLKAFPVVTIKGKIFGHPFEGRIWFRWFPLFYEKVDYEGAIVLGPFDLRWYGTAAQEKLLRKQNFLLSKKYKILVKHNSEAAVKKYLHDHYD